MKKAKATNWRLIAGKIEENLVELRTKVRTLAMAAKYPKHRLLATVDVADAQGKLNGLTIAEIITMVNILAIQGEKLVIEKSSGGGKTIGIFAEKVIDVPVELLQ